MQRLQNLCFTGRNIQVELSKLDMFMVSMLIGLIKKHDSLSRQTWQTWTF